MNIVKRIAKNIGVMGLGTGINSILSFILVIFYARYLGDIAFGKYAFALSFIALFAILGDLGLSILAVREVASDRSRAQTYLNNIISIKIVASVILLVLMSIIISFMDYPKDTTITIYILGGSVIFTLITSGIRWLFQAFQILEFEALIVVSLGLLRLLGGISVLIAGYGIIELALVDMGSNAIILIFAYLIISKKFFKPKIKMDLIFWKKTIITAFPLALMVLFSAIYLNIDTVMLSIMKGDAPTGWYKAAYKLVGVIKLIPAFFIPAVFPAMSELFSQSHEKFIKVGEKSLFLLIGFGLPLSLATTILADKIILLIFGEAFINSILVLKILIWTSLFVFFSSIMGYMLIAAGKQKINTFIVGIGLLLNIILNIILIPKYSYAGAAVSIFIAELIVAILASFCAYKLLSFKHSLVPYLKVLVSSFIMGVTVYYLRNINLFFIVMIGMVEYYLILHLIRGITIQDREAIKNVLFNKNF